MNAFTKVKGLVYPSSTLWQQGRETHLQGEIWSIMLNNKPTLGTTDVKCVVFGCGQDARARSFAADYSGRSCVGLWPIPKHPATLEKKPLSLRIEEKKKTPPHFPPPPQKNKVTDTSYLPTVTTLDFFFFLLSFAVNFSFLIIKNIQ